MALDMDMGIFLGLILLVAVTETLFRNFVPNPYMDEIFHCPQAQNMWVGNYTWDPKITTLPGLYYVSMSVLRIFNWFTIVDDSCSVRNLRFFNAFALCISFLPMYYILCVKRPYLSLEKKAFCALTLTLFPLHYFFGFLYYTDVLSTLLVISMFSYSYFGHTFKSALCGAVAVFTRQTNIVWIVLQITQVVWETLQPEAYVFINYLKELRNEFKVGKKRSGRQRRTPRTRQELIDIWMRCARVALPKTRLYGLILLGFAVFVVYNGGIAVGDKDAHQVSINAPQIIYFGLFCGFFMAPVLLPCWKDILTTLRDHWLGFIFCCLVGVGIVHFNTVVHPYLLADNRHYTFYIWKRLYEWYPMLKYPLVPISMAVWAGMCSQLDFHPALSFSYIFCICAVLIPQRLLEFRYFIVPYFLLRLNMRAFEWEQLIPEFILYLSINVITIYLFLSKTFLWPDSDETQRFMW